MTARPATIALTFFSAFLAFGNHARAATPSIASCVAAANEGQTLRDDGKLVSAHARFATCVATECPDVVRHDCGRWLDDVDARTPSIVARSKRVNGEDVTPTSLSIDGHAVDSFDGRPLLLDPGRHTIEASLGATDAARATATFVLVEREKSRIIDLVFPASGTFDEPSPSPSPASRSHLASYVLYGVSGVALASFTIFGALGYSEWSDLDSRCKGHCTDSEVESTRAKFIVADISLGVGIVAAAVGTFLLLKSSHAEPSARALARPQSPILFAF